MARSETEGRRFSTPSSEAVKPRLRETLPGEERPRVRGVAVDFGETKEAKRTKHRDDAFWIERTPTGFELIVSVTDVAAAVPHNSDIDLRARRNDKKGAMLRPFEGKDVRQTEVGLTSNADRLSVTTTIPLDKNFDIAGPPRFQLTKIKLETGGELAHEEVSDILQDPYHEMHEMFRDAANTAVNLREKREERGAIPSTKLPPMRDWQRTEAGSIQLTSFEDPILPHMMVEEIMVIKNSAITRFLKNEGYPAIHKGRDVRDGEPSREEIIADLQDRKDELSQRRYKEEVEWIIHRQTESFYSPFPETNVVLNEEHTQNTSPMRKYDALINQRILIAAIKGEPPPYSQMDLNRICRRLNSSPELNYIHPGERVPKEVPKGVTNDQRLQRKLRADLRERKYVGEKFQELKIKAERRKAEGKKLVGDEKLMDDYLEVSKRVEETSPTKTTYIKAIRGPRGERISVNGKERRIGAVKPKEVFPGTPEIGTCIVSISKLNDFKGLNVTVEELIKQKLVDERAREVGVKIHATGNLKLGKSLNIVGIGITDNAAAKILARKGTVQDVPQSREDLKRKNVLIIKSMEAKEKRMGIYPYGDNPGPSGLDFWRNVLKKEKEQGIYPYGESYGPTQIPESGTETYIKKDTSDRDIESVKVAKAPSNKTNRVESSERNIIKKEAAIRRSIRWRQKLYGIYPYGNTNGPSELAFWEILRDERQRGIYPYGKVYGPSQIPDTVMETYYANRIKK